MVPAHAGRDETEWNLDVDASPLSLALAYVFPSVLGGAVVLVGGALVVFFAASVLAGNFRRAIAAVVVTALALVSRRYLPAALETNATNSFFERFSRRGLLVGSLLGALVLLGSALVNDAAPFVVFVASWVPLVVTATFPTSGRADPSTGTLVVDGDEVPLQQVWRVRTLSLGAIAVCWLSYVRGAPTAPRFVIVPADAVGVVTRLVERAPESTPDDQSTIGRPERVVAGLFGVGLLAIGPVLWVALPSGDARVIALYAGALFDLFGLLLLWYAYRA
ncbi:hypothetical protein SAMN04488065_0452 [Haloplanus vescus]|uniref:Uncharacterized protein n=1 Tax=Haloplanus vescus TaxID=555874 RepID=A0A1H3W265_9EURY|nr:hypothetical protein [Haloplanus vescus]SDZ80504.1 hypothetical protein SAMN04488065_0452 [Haloplanus vescus]